VSAPTSWRAALGDRASRSAAYRSSASGRQFIRYLVVGTTSFGVDLAVLAVLVDGCGVPLLAAGAVGFCAGVTVNYLIAVRWVFPHRVLRRAELEFLVYLLIGLSGLALNEFVLWALAQKGGIHYAFAKAVSGAIVLLWTFGSRSLLLFRAPPKAMRDHVARAAGASPGSGGEAPRGHDRKASA
jgi:putative flippase GtrA